MSPGASSCQQQDEAGQSPLRMGLCPSLPTAPTGLPHLHVTSRPRVDGKQNLSLDCSLSCLFFMMRINFYLVLVHVSVPLPLAAESHPKRYDGHHRSYSVERRRTSQGQVTHIPEPFPVSQSPISCTGFPTGGETGGMTLLYLAPSPVC